MMLFPRRLFTFARIPVLRGPSLLPTFRPSPRLPLTHAPRATQSRLFQHFPARLSASPPPESLPPDASRMQRLKHLFRSYGFYALGVYFVLSVLDFGLAFGLIHIIGAEYVEHLTKSAKDLEGLYAMLILAYTVHKTLFLPLRVGLTAWLTPTLVGWLRQRGWAGGAGTMRAATEMRERLRSGKNRPPRQD
ncbi:hypothetical protein C8F01DRAFT_1216128 [Mycena amicta]|nr:hypothetical protein C8F01DRAFT_1216128 [Mycena amicta]